MPAQASKITSINQVTVNLIRQFNAFNYFSCSENVGEMSETASGLDNLQLQYSHRFPQADLYGHNLAYKMSKDHKQLSQTDQVSVEVAKQKI